MGTLLVLAISHAAKKQDLPSIEESGFIWMVIIGLGVASFARLFISGKVNFGFLMTMVVGVLGSFLFGLLGWSLQIYYPGQNEAVIGSFIGAVFLIVLFISLSK
ncbi:MAG: GlsB/YeaQ/YmgE family stress response membrane protein [candidate division KSB1 bacterium]|nr:GlsB/YeaQ/YmgE family stress response membrane protein [candidate division KSB1 bacterium]